MKLKVLCSLALLAPFSARAEMVGESHPFTSPGGIVEQCVRPDKIPGGKFSKKDDKSETELCSYDIYRQEVAVCPKIESTSPGTFLYSTEGTNLTQAQFEAQRCTKKFKSQNTKLTKFKNSMNQKDTSGTLSQASLLYYQFSRYFDMTVQVPVAVYRSFDKDQHLQRVSLKAKPIGKMNAAGWAWEVNSEKNPKAYDPVSDLFTSDLKQIYGVLLDEHGGERYGAEVNGIRSPGLIPENVDFLSTPGFSALRSEQPFSVAITTGIAAGKANAKMSTDVGTLPLTPVQVGLWMHDLVEITLLDYIFQQQDRVGNIDFYWAWAYNDGREVQIDKEKRKEFKFKKGARKNGPKITMPAEIAQFKPTLVQRSIINDNDAGGRPQYMNVTAHADKDPRKDVRMLEKTRHYDAELYRKLIALNNDLQSKGAVYAYLRDKLNLVEARLNMIVKNTASAAAILQGTCGAGKLRFDLDIDQIINGQVSEVKVADCARP